MAPPNASASALKRAIRDFLAENGDSPAADDLRKAEKALGAADSPGQRDTPGSRAARGAAGGGGDQEDRNARGFPSDLKKGGDAKPDSPGADMNNAPSIPFKGIKRRETAKALAHMRFKKDKKRA